MTTPPSTSPRPGRRRRGGCLLRGLGVLVLLGSVGGLTLHFFGDTLVPPLVDAVRGVIGPAAMAQVEADYYGVIETTTQWQRDLGLAPKVTAPWDVPASDTGPAPALSTGGGVPAPGTRILPEPVAPDTTPPAAVPSPIGAVPTGVPEAAGPTSVPAPGSDTPAAPPVQANTPGPPLATPSSDGVLAGEGVWISTGLPQPPQGGAPVFWKTFLRPDAARPNGLVYLVRFDPRRVRLHIVAGTKEPVSATHAHGSGEVAAADLPNLIAAFNGGFKTINGHYGMMAGGQMIAPPSVRSDTATLAMHADGRLELRAWQALSTTADLVSFRQNCPLMIDNGAIVVQDHSTTTWGLSALNAMYVWRSGIGMTADGSLIYAAGSPLSASELATALRQAGAVYAMQLDINSAWVHWLNYTHDADGQVRVAPLVHGMAYRQDQYLVPGDRDFFYLTWK